MIKFYGKNYTNNKRAGKMNCRKSCGVSEIFEAAVGHHCRLSALMIRLWAVSKWICGLVEILGKAS